MAQRIERLANLQKEKELTRILQYQVGREVDPHRHKARLEEDIQYRRIWLES